MPYSNEDNKVDSAFINRKQVLKNLVNYVNTLCKIWKKSIEKKPSSVEWWVVSFFNISTPGESECQECLESLVMKIGQLSQTVEDPLQFKTYLDAFVNLATETTVFQGSPAEVTFSNLVNYLNKVLENDLKQTSSIEIPDLKTSNLSQ